MGGVPVVEADMKALEVPAAPPGDLGDEGLRGFPRLFRRQHDGRAVRVVGAHEMHLVALHALEPHPDVGLDVLHHVADVERRVRVGQRGGDEEPAGGHVSEAGLLGKGAILAYTLKMPLSDADVQGVLKQLVDPNTGKDFLSTRSARNMKVSGNDVSLDLELGYPGRSQSQPMMLGIAGRPESRDGKSLEPMEGHGLQAISIGFLIDIDTPMVWRGPMVTQALEQLLKDTRWRDLDYLVVDLPPGTGDIQLTLAQKVPVTGAVIVTTPQDIAIIDARKGLRMFEKVGIPILGVVENMSSHVCPKCGHQSHIFGVGGAEKMCRDYGTELLGQLPLDEAIRSQADSGKPTVVADPDGPVAEIYRRIARRCAVRIAESQRDMTSKFPNIVVQNT